MLHSICSFHHYSHYIPHVSLFMWVEYPFNTISLNDFLAGLSCSISSLVYCMRTENVVSVMCNGHWIMKDKKILLVNEVLGSYFSLVSLNI